MMTRENIHNLIQDNIVNPWLSMRSDALTEEEWAKFSLQPISSQSQMANESLLNVFFHSVEKNNLDVHYFLSREGIISVKKYLGDDLCKAYFSNISAFYQDIRKTDSSFSLLQLWQVMSNFLIYSISRSLLNKDQSYNDAIKSFCLLYPYTDNYIDNPSFSNESKASFNQMILSALEGNWIASDNMSSDNELANKINQCILNCKNHLDGSMADIIKNSLLLMLDSQENSSRFDGMGADEYEKNYQELIRILAYKGGMTLINDYIFATDEINTDDIIFFLKLGMVLQMADDLLDTNDDYRANIPTLFSLVPSSKIREENLNRLMRFTGYIFSSYNGKNETVKTFMLRTIMLVFGFGVFRNEKYYSDEFKNYLAKYMPFSKEYLVKINQKLNDAANASVTSISGGKTSSSLKKLDNLVAHLKF